MLPVVSSTKFIFQILDSCCSFDSTTEINLIIWSMRPTLEMALRLRFFWDAQEFVGCFFCSRYLNWDTMGIFCIVGLVYLTQELILTGEWRNKLGWLSLRVFLCVFLSVSLSFSFFNFSCSLLFFSLTVSLRNDPGSSEYRFNHSLSLSSLLSFKFHLVVDLFVRSFALASHLLAIPTSLLLLICNRFTQLLSLPVFHFLPPSNLPIGYATQRARLIWFA